MATQASESEQSRTSSGAHSDLAVVAQRAQAFTNASGVAIALAEGNSEEIICRARSGSSAPEVGAALRVEGSFTGLSIQSGKEMRCDDAETDTRVDTTAIRALGIRSIVVTPIKSEGKVVGVLAVFAPIPHAFTITHVAVLKTMADQVAALLQKGRRTREDGHVAEPELGPTPVTMPKPVAAVPASMVIKPSAVPAPRVPAVSSQPPAKPEVETARPVPFPKKEDKRTEFRPEIATLRNGLGTFDALANQDKGSGKKFIVIGAVAVVMIAASVVFALKIRKPAAENNVSVPATKPAESVPPTAAAAAPVTTAPEPPQPVANPAPSSSSAVQPAEPASNPGRSKPSSADTGGSRKLAKISGKEAAKSASKEATQAAPEEVALSSGPSKIRVGSAQPQQPTGDAAAPTLAVSSASGQLSSLARPVDTVAPSVLMHSDLVAASCPKQVAPVYPPLAKARRLSGAVTVKFLVGKDGRTHNPQLLDGSPIFKDATFEAVQKWQCKPALLNSQPVEQEILVKLNFHP